MRNVCGGVPLCNAGSSGGVQNIAMLSANEAELGLVQVDLLNKLKESDHNVGALKAVMPLHANLLHVITLTEGSVVGVKYVPGTSTAVPYTGKTVVLKRYSDLQGMTVALVGSAQLTVQMLEERKPLGLQVKPADSDDQAIAQLKRGEVQAVLTLAGWPMPAMSRLRADGGLMLAAFDVPHGAPYDVVKRNYQNLGALNLPMLAVPNLLVARPFKPAGSQGQQVSALQQCLGRQLDELKDGRYQAAWKEIGDPAVMMGWARWEPAAAATHKPVSK